MGTTWHKTNFSGVRYREHPTRKHGIQKDRYFAIRYQRSGERKEEGVGWASNGWTAEKSALELAKLKEAHTKGEGPTRLAERREIRDTKKKKAANDQLTVKNVFYDHYWPQAQSKKSANREMSLFKNHIEPQIGDRSLMDISQIQLFAIKKAMEKKGAADRSIQYCFAVLRQLFNFAVDNDLYAGNIPRFNKVMPSRVDKQNRRDRYLTKEEADILLDALREKSQETFEIAYVSLHSGLRAGEIFSLRWGDVDFLNELLTVRDAKSGYSRYVPMYKGIKALLQGKGKRGPEDFVFPSKNGEKRKEISKTFDRVVGEIGLNDGVIDRRKKLVFHSLRHTFASWLIQKGESLHTVQHLLGHRTSIMTDRYSHINNEILKKAIGNLK